MDLDIDPATLQSAAEAACRVGLRAGLVEADARDLAQEALLRALTSSRPPAGVPLVRWVYGIARNLGRDHAKSARRREVPVAAPPETAPDADLATVLAVRGALDQLPSALRDIVTLHELEEHSLRETAELLQIPFDTAKDRLRRARAQLRDRLADGDAALEVERTHTRRRAAASGAAIVAAVGAMIAGAPDAAAANAANVTSVTAKSVPAWLAVAAGTLLATGGFFAGRLSAEREVAAPPAVAARGDASGASEVVVAPDAALPPVPPVPSSEPSVTTAAAVTATPARASGSARAASDGAEASVPVVGASAEAVLLDRGRTALLRGMHDEALVTLMAHGRQFPTGDLAEERDVLIIEAYLRAGNHELARRRIARYRAEHARGVLGARVDAFARTLPP